MSSHYRITVGVRYARVRSPASRKVRASALQATAAPQSAGRSVGAEAHATATVALVVADTNGGPAAGVGGGRVRECWRPVFGRSPEQRCWSTGERADRDS